VKVRGVPSGYVEGLNDARTQLADFFSFLLVKDTDCGWFFVSLRSFHMLQPEIVEVCDGIGFSP
jgi:hypothetical protein